jgi:hypothetical protein
MGPHLAGLQSSLCLGFLMGLRVVSIMMVTAQTATINMGGGLPPNPHLFGQNPAFSQATLVLNLNWPPPGQAAKYTPFNNTLFQDMFNTITTGTLRWPDGTSSNYWDWQNGFYMDPNSAPCQAVGLSPTCSSFANDNNTLANTPSGYYIYDNYYRQFCQSFPSCATTYVLNVLTDTVANNIAFLSHAVTNGIPPQYVEIGNELYLSGNEAIFPANASAYISVVQQIYTQGKAVSNSLRFGVPVTYSGGAVSMWNNHIKTGLVTPNKYLDAVIVHTYLPNPTQLKSWTNTQYWLNWYMAAPEAVLTGVANYYGSNFPGIPIWMTEFGQDFYSTSKSPNSTERTWLLGMAGTAYHALFVATFPLVLSRYPSTAIEIAMSWFSIGNTNTYTFMTNSSGTYSTPISQVLAHLLNVTLGASQVYPLEFDSNVPSFNNTQWFGFYNQTLPTLLGAAFQSNSSDLTIVLLNRDNATVAGLQLPDTSQYNSMEWIMYDASAPLSLDGFYSMDFPSTPAFPWPGPMSVSTTSHQKSSGSAYFIVDVQGTSLNILTFSGSQGTDSDGTDSAAGTILSWTTLLQ